MPQSGHLTVSVTAGDLAANVVRPVRKINAVAVSPGIVFDHFDDPDAVALHRASGGFNSVMEFAARSCVRWFISQIATPEMTMPVSPTALAQFRASLSRPFDDSYLNNLPIAASDPSYGLGLSWSVADLEFKDPHQVCITYHGELDLLQQAPVVPIRPPVWRSTPTTIGPAAAAEEPRVQAASGPAVARVPAIVSSAFGGASAAPGGAFALIGGRPQPPLVFLHTIGPLQAVLCCDYKLVDDPALTRCSVYADLPTAQVAVTPPPGDVALLFDHFLRPASATQLNTWFTTVTTNPNLTPLLSLVGSDNAGSVPELPDFEAVAFHVGSHPRQALVIAFNLSPGCQGTIEDVQQFLGSEDFGVISDEVLVEAVFKHKWNQGGFYRQFAIQNQVVIKRNGDQQNATLNGTLVLDSLDFVRIETEANTGTDYVRIGGSATITPTSLQLEDGTIVGPDKANLGDPQSAPWSVYTNFGIDPPLSSDAQLRAFQIQAHDDAYQFIARPFAASPADTAAVQIDYARTEGVPQRVFFLGMLPTVFA